MEFSLNGQEGASSACMKTLPKGPAQSSHLCAYLGLHRVLICRETQCVPKEEWIDG
jgi:hypothetical protein